MFAQFYQKLNLKVLKFYSEISVFFFAKPSYFLSLKRYFEKAIGTTNKET